MKKEIITLIFCLSCALTIDAQKADMRIGELINNEDWFGLIDEYPELKDSLQTPYLGLMAETMIYRYTNRQPQAIECINQLLTKHQSELGGSIYSFIILRALLLADMGDYAQSADFLRNAIDQFKALGATGLDTMERYWQSLNSIRDYPATTVSRPNKDTHIHFTLKEVKPKRIEPWMRKKRTPDDKALAITLPVQLHGETIPFIFDTGAERTFLSERVAKEKGLELIGDTIKMNGNKAGLRTYIDSLQIGDIIVRNIIAYVGTNDNSYGYDLVGFEVVLGRDVMTAIGETQINMADSTLTFPIKATPLPPDGCNMLSNSFVKAKSGNDSFYMLFDTGNGNINSCSLFGPYYKAHADEINAKAVADTISSIAYGMAGAFATKVIKDFTLSIDNHPIHIDEVHVGGDNSVNWLNKSLSGNIGMAAVMQSRKITLNYKDMFVKFE